MEGSLFARSLRWRGVTVEATIHIVERPGRCRHEARRGVPLREALLRRHLLEQLPSLGVHVSVDKRRDRRELAYRRRQVNV